jgi:hypothetical protein
VFSVAMSEAISKSERASQFTSMRDSVSRLCQHEFPELDSH